MKTAMWQISVAISESAEDAISQLFERIFGNAPSIYTDANSHKTIASLYLKKFSDWNSPTKSQLQHGLKLLRESGLNSANSKILVKKLQPQDWAESWKKHFKPIQIGDALLIKPSWSKVRPRKNQALVILDPGLSFGTGQHATTSFCLQQIVARKRVAKGRAQSFLDIGTGSGILAIAAAKLGFSPVRAFDFDPDAVRIAKANALENDVAEQINFARQDLTKIPLQSKMKYDLICANLIYDLLLSERERILNRVARGGSLVLAGILKTQFPRVKMAFEEAGMKLRKTKIEKEWQSGEFVFCD